MIGRVEKDENYHRGSNRIYSSENIPKRYKSTGSITVFLSLIFILVFSLILSVVENTRVVSSKSYVSTAAETAVETVFAEYNKELFEVYHLLGYGGYDGRNRTDIESVLLRGVQENLVIKPQETKNLYADLYRVVPTICEVTQAISIASHEEFQKQITCYLKAETLENLSEKLIGKVQNKEIEKQNLSSDFLSEVEGYEKGEYDCYHLTQEESDEISTESEKLQIEEGKKEIQQNLKEDAAGGNPLELFEEVVDQGVLSLVCNPNELSDLKIRSREITIDSEENAKEKKNEDSTNFVVSTYLGTYSEEGESLFDSLGEEFVTDQLKVCTYAQNIFSYYGNENELKPKYGLEYLIAGEEKESENLATVVERLLAIRLIIDFIYVSKDPVLQQKSLTTATIIAGFTGLEALITAIQYSILLILAYQEACIDVCALLEGKNVPYYKTAQNFYMTYEEICLGSHSLFQKKAQNYVSDTTQKDTFTLSYQQYLSLFLLLVPTERLENRIWDLIEYDLQERYNQSFYIESCYSSIFFDVTYQMPMLFAAVDSQVKKKVLSGKIERKAGIYYAYKN